MKASESATRVASRRFPSPEWESSSYSVTDKGTANVPGTSVIGLQWGDEAKGKIVDLLTERSEIVVRYQGGANAGHTVVANGERFKLSLIPSGIFRPSVQCVIAGGVVLNPPAFLEETQRLIGQGVEISRENLMISDRAHVIFPWHGVEDRVYNNITGGEAIGTTMRGIGPCYQDKVGRSLAIRFGDLFRSDLEDRVNTIVGVKNRFFRGLFKEVDTSLGLPGWDVDLDGGKIYKEYAAYAKQLEPFRADTTAYLLDAVDAGKSVLFEGAQGSLLDVDHGTFPFVTSSNRSAASSSTTRSSIL